MAKNKLMNLEIYELQAEICAALASPVRLQVLDLIGDGELTASELLEELGIPKSNLSQHVKVLKQVGILRVRSEGLFQYLSLAIPEVKQACALVRKVLAKQATQQAELAKTLRSRIS